MKRGRPPIDDPCCKRVMVRLTPGDLLTLINLADAAGNNMSEVIRGLIRKAVI